MQTLARDGYTSEQVKKQLHAANRVLAFRYDLLDNQNKKIGQLDNVLAASIANNTFADIKKTGRFNLKENNDINFLSDRIKPWVWLIMPDRGWAKFAQGVFLLSTPPRKVTSEGIIIRDVEAYDQLQVLTDDAIENRYTVAAGTNYISEVRDILEGAGITSVNLTATDKTLPEARDWPPGTKKLQIINDLIGAISYRSLYFDENGIAIAQPYVSPQVRASEYTYQNNDESVIFPDVEQSLDLFAVPNKFIAVCSEPDRDPLVSSYTNSNPNSPTSTISRGRVITAEPKYVEAADQASLDAIVQKMAFKASQVYEQVPFYSSIMPFHGENDCLTLVFSKLGISAKYTESSWNFDLKKGARMKHLIRRVVDI